MRTERVEEEAEEEEDVCGLVVRMGCDGGGRGVGVAAGVAVEAGVHSDEEVTEGSAMVMENEARASGAACWNDSLDGGTT